MKMLEARLMIEFSASALLLGFIFGLPVSALFFWGLAVGMRRALHQEHPAIGLLASFLLRSSLVVLVAYLLTLWLQPFWAMTGLTLAFFLMRLVSVRLVLRKREQ